MLGRRDKTIMSSGLLYEASGGAAVGGMPGCPAKPTDLVSRGALIWGAFCFLGSRQYILYEGLFIRDSSPRLTYTNNEQRSLTRKAYDDGRYCLLIVDLSNHHMNLLLGAGYRWRSMVLLWVHVTTDIT